MSPFASEKYGSEPRLLLWCLSPTGSEPPLLEPVGGVLFRPGPPRPGRGQGAGVRSPGMPARFSARELVGSRPLFTWSLPEKDTPSLPFVIHSLLHFPVFT